MTYTIQSLPDKGSGIVTTASLRWGDVILEQEPYAAVLYDAQTKESSHYSVYDDQIKERCHYSMEAAEARKCVRAAVRCSIANAALSSTDRMCVHLHTHAWYSLLRLAAVH